MTIAAYIVIASSLVALRGCLVVMRQYHALACCGYIGSRRKIAIWGAIFVVNAWLAMTPLEIIYGGRFPVLSPLDLAFMALP